jgi:hypothetical protein
MGAGTDGQHVVRLGGFLDPGQITQQQVVELAVLVAHLLGDVPADIAGADDDQPRRFRVRCTDQVDAVVAYGHVRSGRQGVQGGRPQSRRAVDTVRTLCGPPGDGHGEDPRGRRRTTVADLGGRHRVRGRLGERPGRLR